MMMKFKINKVKKIGLVILIVSTFLLNSCKDPWEDRFQGDIPESSIWETLVANPDFAGFVMLMEETGYDSVLQRNTVFTLLIPQNFSMDMLASLSLEEKKSFAGYHISNSILYSSDVSKTASLKSLIGKNILFSNTSGELVLNNEVEIVAADLLASNGVLFVLSDNLTPRPNLIQYLSNDDDFSFISHYFDENTLVVFDEVNSIPIDINEFGETVYDTAWLYFNEFFNKYADLSSEDNYYTIFLADDLLLDTTSFGNYKDGFVFSLPNLIVEGLYGPNSLPAALQSVGGSVIDLPEDDYSFVATLSNGIIYKLNSLSNLIIPSRLTWEPTSIASFDSIRYVKKFDYKTTYDQLESIRVTNLNGEFTNFMYDITNGPVNSDYLRIVTTSGSSCSIEFDIPDLTPYKYLFSINAMIRQGDGVDFDAYLNDYKIASSSFNTGSYFWNKFELGEVEVTRETGNVIRIDIKGSNAIKTKAYIDYFLFEPIN